MDMNEIVIASKNENKVREIEQILDNTNLKIVSLNSFPDIPDIEETGDTFLANARLKSQHYHRILDMPVIADDSGLVVPALGGEPGIYSARYAGIQSDYQANNQKLLKNLTGFQSAQRNAYFICVMLYLDEKCELDVEGRAHGRIIEKPVGKNGFGYDPVFYHPESKMTFAQMDANHKNRTSHRFLALQELNIKLNRHWRNL
jgi:XTP/dITP diphosphohydrolase